MKKRNALRATILILAILLVGVIVAVYAQFGASPEHYLTDEENYVFFINVGRGDAILVRSGDKYLLIDAGSKAHSDELVSALRLAGVEKLDALVVTHENSDHFGGVAPLSEQIPIERVYCPKFSERDKNDKNKLKKKLKKLGLKTTSVAAGDVIELGDVKLDVLGPAEYLETGENDNSVVLRGEIGGLTYLFTGDMEFAEESSVIATGAKLDCDVLKVANHGQVKATSAEFAALASPKVSIVTTSTKADGNTASVKVRDILTKYGKFHVTENSEHGILTFEKDGEIMVLYI